SDSFIDLRAGVKLAVRRLMCKTETKLHDKSERNGEKERSPKAVRMRCSTQQGDRRCDCRGRQNDVQPAWNGELIRVSLANEPTVSQGFAEVARISPRCLFCHH